MNFKSHFPIFQNNPNLVYLDNAATVHKPYYVIEQVNKYIENDYSNIHRWQYEIAVKSEEIYYNSKQTVANFIWGNYEEIIYTFNATYAFNILAWSLFYSWFLKKWDKILLSLTEHHANIVPYLLLKKFWIQVEFINITEDLQIDLEDFKKKYTSNVKLIALWMVSNVTWSVLNIEDIWKLKREDTLLIVDWSQAVPNFQVNVKNLNCDFFVFTWHKMMAFTGIGVIWWKQKLIKQIQPAIGWWGAVQKVTKNNFIPEYWAEKFEVWTPNLIWAVSLQKAFEYIQSIWWYKTIQEIEKKLIDYAIKQFYKRKDYIQVFWLKAKKRVGIFSFILKNWPKSFVLWEKLAKYNIAVRCWWHCAHPYVETLWKSWVCRISFYLYNDLDDIKAFFDAIDKIYG